MEDFEASSQPTILPVQIDDDQFVQRVTPEDNINWNVVALIVEKYTERHVDEVRGCVEFVKDKRTHLDNKFGETSKDTQMRHMYELPPSLHFALTLKYPKIFKEKQHLDYFLKSYPMFRVPEKL